MEFGQKLNPERSLRIPKGIKGTRQKVIVTHNPSEIDENQLLLIRFPNLGSDDVIVPGSTNLSFNIDLNSKADTKRTLVDNIGRAIIKKLAVKFEGNEVLSVDDFDVFVCYRDLWLSKYDKRNKMRQGIIHPQGNSENAMNLRVGASNGDVSKVSDKAISDTYGNKFIIPLNFELLDSVLPFNQSGLGNKLAYEITFSNYNRVIKSTPAKPSGASSGTSAPSPDAKYKISNISLEYEIITHDYLATSIREEYRDLVVLYDRILRHRLIQVKKVIQFGIGPSTHPLEV